MISLQMDASKKKKTYLEFFFRIFQQGKGVTDL